MNATMSVITLLERLQSIGVEFALAAGGLRFRDPAKAMSDSDRLAIKEHRDGLIELLSPPAPAPPSPTPKLLIGPPSPFSIVRGEGHPSTTVRSSQIPSWATEYAPPVGNLHWLPIPAHWKKGGSAP